MKTHDYSYLLDAVAALFIQRGCGRFEDAVAEFLANPEMADVSGVIAADQLKRRLVHSLAARFDEADQKEHDTPPDTPLHIRQSFLPFHIDIPPMSPTVLAFDGKGRLPMAEASPKQHQAHHRKIGRYHARGFRYRDENAKRWGVVIEQLQNVPDTDHLEDLPMRKIPDVLQESAIDTAPTPAAVNPEP